jgi:general secretion pathway protein I
LTKAAARGFTLLEVLVALAILAVGLAASIRAGGGATRESDELRLRLLAAWTAENCMADLRARQRWPEPGRRDGYVEQAGTRLHWQEEVSNSPNALFRRVEIRVERAAEAGAEPSPGAPLGHLLAYLPAI